MITKPTSTTHSKTTNPTNNRVRGASEIKSEVPVGLGIIVTMTGSGVTLAVPVAVAGNISVNAGSGTSVAVAVTEGVAEGVKVAEGVPNVAVGVIVLVPANWYCTAA